MDQNPVNSSNNSPQQSQGTSLWQILGLLIIVFILGMGAAYLIWARPLESKLAEAQQAADDALTAANSAATQQAAEVQADPQAEDVRRYDISLDDDPTYGPANAPITIIEFSDYECPFCTKWHTEVLPQLKATYGDQIRFVYRDFPLVGLHDNAAPAAEAANCAGDQNRYWEYHDLLFSGEQRLNRKTYEAYAKTLQLDLESFKLCLDDRRYQKEVEADYNYASELGIQSTPTFFINGLAIVGAQPFSVFKQVIDLELAGEIP